MLLQGGVEKVNRVHYKIAHDKEDVCCQDLCLRKQLHIIDQRELLELMLLVLPMNYMHQLRVQFTHSFTILPLSPYQ
jgi:hypothetical protein